VWADQAGKLKKIIALVNAEPEIVSAQQTQPNALLPLCASHCNARFVQQTNQPL
jgi:hypothetical protein